MKHFFGGEGGHGSGPPYEIAPEEQGRHSPSTPLVMKVTSTVYNPPFQKFLDPPMKPQLISSAETSAKSLQCLHNENHLQGSILSDRSSCNFQKYSHRSDRIEKHCIHRYLRT